MAIQKALRFAGITQVTVANTWEKCLVAMEKNPPTLLLLDLIMPDHDGEELLPAIISRWPDCAVIIVTGEHDIQRAVRCIKKGAVEYLTKPVSIQPLQMLIETYMPEPVVAPVIPPEEAVRRLFSWYDSLFTSPSEVDSDLLDKIRRWVLDNGWKSPAATLRSTADFLGSNTSYLSRRVNRQWNCSFPTWLNRIRLVSFLRTLSEHSPYSIEAIIAECGFKSRSAFYSALKKEIGASPQALMRMNIDALMNG